jgi:capsular polysaccharide transport system permease protein
VLHNISSHSNPQATGFTLSSFSSQDRADNEPRLRSVHEARPLATGRAIMALVLREMQTTYGRSPGGYVWALLEPVGAIVLLTLIFSSGFRSPPIGSAFAPFYASGMVPFLLFTTVSNQVSEALKFSRQLLAYPSVTFVDALVARFIVNGMTQLLVGYIVFTGVLMLYDTQGVLDLERLVLSFAMVLALAAGIGTLNCFLKMRFPVWGNIWSILTRPLFIISCIFFLFEAIPQPYQDWLWYNPLVHVVGVMREGFYSTYDASYVSVSYVMGLSMISLTVGLLMLYRFHRDLLDR